MNTRVRYGCALVIDEESGRTCGWLEIDHIHRPGEDCQNGHGDTIDKHHDFEPHVHVFDSCACGAAEPEKERQTA
jgi:hypothetical protein